MPDVRPEVLGARSVGDTSCLQELKLVKEPLNDEMSDNEEDESKSSHSEKSGAGLYKLWICMGFCPGDLPRIGGGAGHGAHIVWGCKRNAGRGTHPLTRPNML